jgi:hypothetical protein
MRGDGVADLELTLEVYWHQASTGSVSSHVQMTRRDLIAKLESRTHARFEPTPMQQEFVYA